MPEPGRARVGATVLLMILLLTGCTAGPTSAEPTATAGPGPGDTATPAPGTGTPLSHADGPPGAGVEVATGELVSADGTATGRVSLVTNGKEGIDVRIDDLSVTPVLDLRVYLIPERLGPDDPASAADSIQLELGLLTTPTGSQEFLFGQPWLWGEGDPSFLKTLQIVSYPERIEDPAAPSAAVAQLAWTYRKPRAVTVNDSGPNRGARGIVEVAGGVPVGYTVARDDLVAEIAARFGISVGDLLWLNPVRGKNEAIAGEELNLSPMNR